MTETVFTNAALVLPDAVVHGTLVVHGGVIADIQPGGAHTPGAVDLDGDYLLPGVVDVHTDNLERQVEPRSGARWPSRSAMLAHDAQCAAAGVTTVLDALCIGDLGFDADRMQTTAEGLADLDALSGTGLLKADHFLHLRCELPASDMLAMFDRSADHPLLRMVSLMDHSPGIGQYADLDYYRRVRRRGGAAEAAIEQRIGELLAQRERLRAPNRRGLLARMSGRAVTLASHDDRTVAEIAENAADGIGISEFPVSMEAALAAHAAGMRVIAGAPNLVRGGSHSGNVAASALLDAAGVDAFASDYVPAALVEAAFLTARHAMGLPPAVAMVTAEPAAMARLADRGRLAPGLRADLVRVRLHEGMPVIRAVWRQGERVA
jgi:alpha-D-ribose 1-methylphosphonate 5-triphosphate diphosphatase